MWSGKTFTILVQIKITLNGGQPCLEAAGRHLRVYALRRGRFSVVSALSIASVGSLMRETSVSEPAAGVESTMGMYSVDRAAVAYAMRRRKGTR